MDRFCPKCMTYVPQGNKCPKCGNEELKKIGEKPKKEKPVKVQNSLVEGKKGKKPVWVFVCIGIAVVMVIVTAVLVMMKVETLIFEEGGDVTVEEVVFESQVTGAEVMNEVWSTNLDASAAFIDGYHAISVEEVLNIWKQAHIQKTDAGIIGNGALIYGICSPALRPRCLEVIKQNYGYWNFYYNAELGTFEQNLVPQEMFFSEPEKFESEDRIRYIVDVNEVRVQGEEATYQLIIEYIDGGYYLAGRTTMTTEETQENA